LRLLHLGCGGRQWRHRLFDDAYDEVRLDLVRNDGLSVVADMSAIPFSGGTFEAAQSSHSAEHLDDADWRRCVSEMRRVLLPCGIAVAVVPDFESAIRWLLDGHESEPLYETGAGIPIYAHDTIFGFQRMVKDVPSMRHRNGFTPKRLYDSFVDAGFENVVVNRLNGSHEIEVIGMA
jgi:SAM-dependent methyltransferase